MSKYDTEVDLANDGTSHAQIVDLVGYNKRVLDVGCASGYLAAVLTQRGCVVSGVEMDERAAVEAGQHIDRVVVGDLESIDLATEFAGNEFDVVVYGDVLEHLRDPLPTLRQGRALLARGGCVVASVPNIAHGAVRLALLRGEFTYRELGLLDVTHVRFFTRDNLEALMRSAGLVMVDTRRTVAGIFETELAIKPEDFPPALVDEILADRDATTYQFVVRAVADDADQAVQDMYQRLRDLDDRTYELERELTAARDEATAHQATVVDQAARLRAAEERVAELEREQAAAAATVSARALRVPRAAYGRLRRLQ